MLFEGFESIKIKNLMQFKNSPAVKKVCVLKEGHHVKKSKYIFLNITFQKPRPQKYGKCIMGIEHAIQNLHFL